MPRKSTIAFEIPVPWSEKPARIRANGIAAVALASIVAVILILAVVTL